jgi:hypothetical protein
MSPKDEAIVVQREFRRREFLWFVGAGPALVAATAGALPPLASTPRSNDERCAPRYRESGHVKTFYRINRYVTEAVPC